MKASSVVGNSKVVPEYSHESYRKDSAVTIPERRDLPSKVGTAADSIT